VTRLGCSGELAILRAHLRRWRGGATSSASRRRRASGMAATSSLLEISDVRWQNAHCTLLRCSGGASRSWHQQRKPHPAAATRCARRHRRAS